eukprot:COSAG02_NODE_125_length_34972_cov_101.069997_24_plen_89_part_00
MIRGPVTPATKAVLIFLTQERQHVCINNELDNRARCTQRCVLLRMFHIYNIMYALGGTASLTAEGVMAIGEGAMAVAERIDKYNTRPA